MKRFLQILTHSIRSKVILLSCSIAFISILIFSGLYYYRFSSSLLEKAADALAAEARLTALDIGSAFDQMQNDAFIISRTPPIQGIIRSMGNRRGVDEFGASDIELWRERLETIFSSVLTERPHYTQIRYIGAANNGKEVVRVDRTETGIKRITVNELQEKGGERYVIEGLQLGDSDVYFSEVNYNRELGQIDSRLIPTIRVVIPVLTERGELWGLVVINANYEQMLNRSLKRVSPRLQTIITNHAGDYLEYNPGIGVAKFVLHTASEVEIPPIITKLRGFDEDEQLLKENEQVAYFIRSKIDPQNPDSYYGVALIAPAFELFEEVPKTFKDTFFIAMSLILCTAVGAGYFSKRLTGPLNRMTRDINAAEIHGSTLELPVMLNDEVGALARGFKSLTQKLQLSEARASAVLDNSVDGIITINEKGIVQAYNKACKTLFGYEAEEVIGQNIKMLMPEHYSNEHDIYLQRYTRTGEKRIIDKGREVEGLRKEGTTFPLHVTVSEIYVDGQRLITGILRDITELKAAEQQREAWIEKLAASNRELEQFAYIASHDLQEPLRKIQAYSERIKTYSDQLDERGTGYIERLDESVSRMQTLINDLLALSRISHNKLEWDMIDLSKVAREAVGDLEVRINETRGRVDIEETAIVEADPRQVRQLFQNLIGNALKFHKEHEAPQVRVYGQRLDGGLYELCIEDQGIGFDEKYLDRIFRPFERLHGRSEYAGTGIGMAICKKIVDRHEGTITARSKEGEGATFIIRLSIRQHSSVYQNRLQIQPT